MRHHMIELALATAFVAAIFISGQLTKDAPTFFAKGAAVALPVIALTAWWLFYAKFVKGLGEFEQAIATKSLAIACGVTLWITTSWGLATIFMDAPALPLVMAAPLAAIIYSIIRIIFAIRYR